MTYFTVTPHQTIDEDSGVVYDACLHDGGAVGLRSVHPDGRVEYIMLNPSGGSDDGVPTVFLYIDTDEPALENAIVHFEMFQEEP
jgi:hypothetical protein